MKKIIPICIIVTMVFTCSISLCFGAEATKPSVSVKVLATLTESSCMISEKVSVAARTYSRSAKVSDLTVTSVVEDQAVTVENIKAVGSNGWTAVSADDVDTAARDSKYINLSMDGNDLNTAAGYDLTDRTVKDTREFSLDGTIAVQSATMDSTEVAKLVVTLKVSEFIIVNGFDVDDLKKVKWTDGTDAEIAAVVEALDEGLLVVSDLVWQVGDSRDVTLTGGSTASLVIWDANTGDGTASAHYKLTDGTGDEVGTDCNYTDADKKTASFIIGIQGLTTKARIWTYSTYKGSWNASEARETVNGDIYGSLPTTIQAMFKTFETVTAQIFLSTTLNHTSDYLALPAVKEVIGGTSPTSYESGSKSIGYCSATEFDALLQFEYFKTTEHYYMYVGSAKVDWWLRSPGESSSYYCYRPSVVDSDHPAGVSSAPNDKKYLVPFGCI
jgi:hypothetical protein